MCLISVLCRRNKDFLTYINAMSRAMWGVVTKASLEAGVHQQQVRKRQTSILDFAPSSSVITPPQQQDRKRSRSGESAAPASSSLIAAARRRLSDAQQVAPQEDGILFGPSGGGNRETQQHRRSKEPMFAGGAGRPEAFGSGVSPYSREYVRGVQELRSSVATDSKEPQSKSTWTCGSATEFDEVLLEPFLAPNCPRDVFAGKVFFLNSCDADPAISVYLLEKLIRRLGGTTSMGVNGAVAYVVSQHVCSAKERKLSKASSSSRRYIHPHFVLACAKAGAVVPEQPYLTIQLAKGSNSTNIANQVTSNGLDEAKFMSAAVEKMEVEDVVLISSEDDSDVVCDDVDGDDVVVLE